MRLCQKVYEVTVKCSLMKWGAHSLFRLNRVSQVSLLQIQPRFYTYTCALPENIMVYPTINDKLVIILHK